MAPVKKGAQAEEPKPPAKRSIAASTGMGSPLKRVKAAIREKRAAEAAKEEINLDTVEAFRDYVSKESQSPPNPDIAVVVTGTLLWKSEHTTGLYELVRMYLTDAAPDDSHAELKELEQLHGSCEENQRLVEGVLLTVTVFGEKKDSPRLPTDGSVIRVGKSRQRKIYDGLKCQMVARASDIVTLSTDDE